MLIDTHTHLDDPEFTEDFDQVLERARATNVTHIISVGVDLEIERAMHSVDGEASGNLRHRRRASDRVGICAGRCARCTARIGKASPSRGDRGDGSG